MDALVRLQIINFERAVGSLRKAKHYLTSTPLHTASECELLNAIGYLLSQDVQLDLVFGSEGKALHTATLNGQVQAVKLLLAKAQVLL